MRRFLSIGLLAVALAAASGCSYFGGLMPAKGQITHAYVGPTLDVTLSLNTPALAEPLHIVPDTADGKGSIFYETADGVHWLRGKPAAESGGTTHYLASWPADGGGTINLAIDSVGMNFMIHLSATGGATVVRWGFNVAASGDEYFTGLMERTVDGPQNLSWAPGVSVPLNLRGQRVEMVVRPTLGLYAPFYVSSRGYGIFTHGTWPGVYDLCAARKDLVQISFEGPDLAMTVYTGAPQQVVAAHSLDSGPTILPPKWAFRPIRWRDEHVNRTTYYDGTPVTAPYNSELVEDVLMMQALGIPCGAEWVDRPFGLGPRGYSDFTWDPKRFPEVEKMIQWLHKDKEQRFLLWIAPWVQGDMAQTAVDRGYALPGQLRNPSQVHIDFSNPAARKWWQNEGIAKFLEVGVDGFKLDRGEEWLSERGDQKVADGRTLTQWRNDYVVEYVRATNEITRKYRGDDFLLYPRSGYTGSSRYSAFWGGDIRGPQEGLRAAIIAQQRCAVMGYPIWGSDTGGYHGEQREPTARWLGFSCFSPLMEVGPTWNKAYWDCPWEPHYDAELIAIWRMYTILHERLLDYTYAQARTARKTGLPIVRPLFMAYPDQPQARDDWQTFLYGPDILVSAVWRNGTTDHTLYLPAGQRWVDAWDPSRSFDGGQSINAPAPLYKIPVFVREGATVDLGDLNALWAESQKIASVKPDLKALQAAQTW